MLYAISSDPLAAAAQGNIVLDVFALRNRWQNHRCSSHPLASNRCGVLCVQPILSTYLTPEQCVGHWPSSLPSMHKFSLKVWLVRFLSWLFSCQMQANLIYWYLQLRLRSEDLGLKKTASVITLWDMSPPCILIFLLSHCVISLIFGLVSFPTPSRDCVVYSLGQSIPSC